MSSSNNALDSTSTKESKGCNVQVVVRCRPVNAEERKSGQPSVITCDQENKAIKVAYGPVGKKIMKSFAFDKVFGMYSRQEEVFNSVVRPIVEETLAGFNCTIFAYGQTGTGKTHTMEGNIHCPEEAGIVPRAVNAILEQLESSGAEFTIRVSFLELYNEELQDLLNVTGEKKLKLCEDVKKGVVCQNLEEIAVLNASDIFDILQRGIQQRQTAATLCNKNSSRSHSIFTMKIMIKECNIDGEEVVRHGQLNLVDLAGSECIGRSGAKDGRAREAGSINQSLLTLGRVITALVDHHQHIPYRDSKLTRLLQESLGGKAKTCIIATFSPSASAVEETMSTLDYAYRAKNIKNQPTVNQKSTKKVIMKEYFAEIETLRNQLLLTREKNGVYLDPQEFYAMESKMAAQESQLLECEAALKARNEEFKSMKVENDELTERLQVTTDELNETTSELVQTRDEVSKVKCELGSAFVELKATEAIVKEQVMTEQDLTITGKLLQGSLESREQAVGQLVQKVSVLETQEQQRLQHANVFVSSMNKQQDALLQKVQFLSTQTAQQSKTLGKGVEQMLVQGRGTCTTLKTALSDALKVLVDETEASRDEMLTSCSDLKETLAVNGQEVVDKFASIAQDLDAWFAATSAHMVQAMEVFQAQSQQMHALSQSMAQQQTSLVSESTQFMTEQSQASQVIATELKSVKAEVNAQAEQYLAQCTEEATKAKDMIKTQAEAMERAMAGMLKDFVSSTTAFSTRTIDQATEYTIRSRSFVDSQVHNLLEMETQQSKQSSAYSNKMQTIMQDSHAMYAAEMEGIENKSTNVQQIATNVDVSVGNKRKYVEELCGDFGAHVDRNTKKSCAHVEKTSAMANTILSNVSTASHQMGSSSTKALEDFVQFMDQEGDALNAGINAHFAEARAEYAQEETMLAAAQSEVKQYHKNIASTTINKSGATPRKAIKTEAPVFAVTRAHDVIKGETKSELEADEVAYETIAAAFPNYEFNAFAGQPAMQFERQLSTTETVMVPTVEKTVEVVAAAAMEESPMVVDTAEEAIGEAVVEENMSENTPPANLNANSGIPTKITTRARSSSKIASSSSRSRSASLTLSNTVVEGL